MIEWLNTVGFDLAIIITINFLLLKTIMTSRRVDTVNNALKQLHEAVWDHNNE
jgi:hypothetical protein